jgi:hypothetical protein
LFQKALGWNTRFYLNTTLLRDHRMLVILAVEPSGDTGPTVEQMGQSVRIPMRIRSVATEGRERTTSRREYPVQPAAPVEPQSPLQPVSDAIRKKLVAAGDLVDEELRHWRIRRRVVVEQLQADVGGGVVGHWEKDWRILPQSVASGAGPLIHEYPDPASRWFQASVVLERSNTTTLAATVDDEHDLAFIQTFRLTSKNHAHYIVSDLGKEALYGEDAEVFQVEPLRMAPGHRYYSGKIWVDPDSFQIRKLHGQGVGAQTIKDQRFPKFETFYDLYVRQLNALDGERADLFRFPTRVIAEDTLWTEDDRRTRVHMTVEFTEYEREKVDSIWRFDERKE